jgi:nucleotide-binding universal stress UspA family protein
MSRIIAATDFSDVAENAVHYACNLALQQKLPLTLLHSFVIPVSFGETPMPIMPVDEGLEIAESQMKKQVEDLRQAYPELALTNKVMYGEIVDCLEEVSEDQAPWLIVVGNSGSGEAGSWLGRSVTSILRHLRSTVIAVAKETSFKAPENICFAIDFKHTDESFQAAPLVDIVTRMNARLHVVNIDSEKKVAEPQPSFESSPAYQALSVLNPVYHHVESEDTDNAIIEFSETNHMDWLVILPQRHSFFEGLFHKSHTKAMVKKTHIPLVAIHVG